MLKPIQLTTKTRKKNQGFSMVEVLVASLIAFVFLMGALQAIVLAVAIRIEAKEKQIASQLIQKDIEGFKREAVILDQNGDRYNVQTSKCTANNYDDSYAKALWNAYLNDPTITSEELQKRQILTQKISIGTGSSGEDQGKELALRRIELNDSSTPPHKTLKIQYEVREWDANNNNYVGDLYDPNDSKIIAKDYIEVIPNAALQCP